MFFHDSLFFLLIVLEIINYLNFTWIKKLKIFSSNRMISIAISTNFLMIVLLFLFCSLGNVIAFVIVQLVFVCQICQIFMDICKIYKLLDEPKTPYNQLNILFTNLNSHWNIGQSDSKSRHFNQDNKIISSSLFITV